MRTQRCEEDRPVYREQHMKLIKERAAFGEPNDIRDAATLRLQVLKYELEFVSSTTITDLSPIVVASYPPRLWIDKAISVVMAPDPRTYRLEQNTATRPAALFETTTARQCPKGSEPVWPTGIQEGTLAVEIYSSACRDRVSADHHGIGK